MEGCTIRQSKELFAFRRWLLERVIWREARTYLRIEPGMYISHALTGEAYAARMYGDNPDLSPDAVKAYRWAEAQFNRIASGKVGEGDLIG